MALDSDRSDERRHRRGPRGGTKHPEIPTAASDWNPSLEEAKQQAVRFRMERDVALVERQHALDALKDLQAASARATEGAGIGMAHHVPPSAFTAELLKRDALIEQASREFQYLVNLRESDHTGRSNSIRAAPPTSSRPKNAYEPQKPERTNSRQQPNESHDLQKHERTNPTQLLPQFGTTSPPPTRKRHTPQSCSMKLGQNSVMQTRPLWRSEPSVGPPKLTSRKQNTALAPCCMSFAQRSAPTLLPERNSPPLIPLPAPQPPGPRLAPSPPQQCLVQPPQLFVHLRHPIAMGSTFPKTSVSASATSSSPPQDPKSPPQTMNMAGTPACPPARTPLPTDAAPSAALALLTRPHPPPPPNAAPRIPDHQPAALTLNDGPLAPSGPTSGTHESGLKC